MRRRPHTEGAEEPSWLSIERLGLVASMIGDQLDDARQQHELLLRARPYVLDDATVDRLLGVYGDAADDLWLYDEQLARWAALPLTPAERREVDRLRARLDELDEVVEAILALSAKLKDQTIERLLTKSDLELGVEWFLRPGNAS